MAKLTYKFNIRDLIIAALALGLILTNYVLFDSLHNQDITNSTNAQGWIYNVAQINRLKTCIDNHVQTCDITTGTPKPDGN